MSWELSTLGEFTARARRSAVFARNGMVASSQPYASEIGLSVLKSGGNAVDAAIAVAAALAVTEPCSTGLGGDCFLLYYEAATRQVHALNGSGRAPAALTRERAVAGLGLAAGAPEPSSLPSHDVNCVTVPGSAAGWADAVSRWGSQPLSRVLEPAARLAEEGFPVQPLTALQWRNGEKQLRRGPHFGELMVGGGGGGGGEPRAPRAGEVFSNPGMARTLRELGAGGARAFYEGRAGRAIVDVLRAPGGTMELSDLAAHASSFPEPLSVRYGDVEVFEVGPNGQGIAALMALNVLEAMRREGAGVAAMRPLGAQVLHTQIEAMRLAFADARAFVADPDCVPVPVRGMLDAAYAAQRRALIDPARARADVSAGSPQHGSDTVSFQVVDARGNAVSMVNSNYEGFGSGIVPHGCGFTLQNRGANFSLRAEHPNVVAPRKRPFHTIIPAIVLHADTRELFATLTNMGGFMQPSGHVQLVCNLVDFKMDPQAAIDAPRFCVTDGEGNSQIALEDGVDADVARQLQAMGHRIMLDGQTLKGHQRSLFGRAQIILRKRATGVLAAGSDGRADGAAMG